MSYYELNLHQVGMQNVQDLFQVEVLVSRVIAGSQNHKHVRSYHSLDHNGLHLETERNVSQLHLAKN